MLSHRAMILQPVMVLLSSFAEAGQQQVLGEGGSLVVCRFHIPNMLEKGGYYGNYG
jgi:hypothetical protein